MMAPTPDTPAPDTPAPVAGTHAAQNGKVPLWLKWQLYRQAMQTKSLAGSAGALSVLFWLLEDFDRDGTRVCAPSLDRIAGLAQTSRRTVVTAIDKLVEAGLVERLEKGGGRYNSTHYAFPWIEARMCDRAKASETPASDKLAAEPQSAGRRASRHRETVKPTSHKPRPASYQHTPGDPETVSSASQNAPQYASTSARNCEDNCEAGAMDTVKPASQDSRDSKNPENPSSPRPAAGPPGPQRHFLLPISGEGGECDLTGLVSRRFHVRRNDAKALVNAWLKRTDRAHLRDLLAEAVTDSVSRDELPGFIKRRLPEPASPADTPAPRTQPPHPATAGAQDSDPSWNRVRQRVRREVGDAPFKAWLAGVGYQGLRGDTAIMIAPNAQVAGWVRSHYADRLRAAWSSENPRIQAIRVEVAEQSAERSAAG